MTIRPSLYNTPSFPATSPSPSFSSLPVFLFCFLNSKIPVDLRYAKVLKETKVHSDRYIDVCDVSHLVHLSLLLRELWLEVVELAIRNNLRFFTS